MEQLESALQNVKEGNPDAPAAEAEITEKMEDTQVLAGPGEPDPEAEITEEPEANPEGPVNADTPDIEVELVKIPEIEVEITEDPEDPELCASLEDPDIEVEITEEAENAEACASLEDPDIEVEITEEAEACAGPEDPDIEVEITEEPEAAEESGTVDDADTEAAEPDIEVEIVEAPGNTAEVPAAPAKVSAVPSGSPAEPYAARETGKFQPKTTIISERKVKHMDEPRDPKDALKAARKAATKADQEHITALTQQIKDAKLPIIVLVEGWAAAGKGTLINDLISEIDPRFYHVFQKDTIRDADRYPFLYPYFNAIPENGKYLFMDGGWMDDCVMARCHGDLKKGAYEKRIASVQRFERTLRDNGYVLIKFFLDLSEKKQDTRQEKLLAYKDTAWRVSNKDLWQNRHYDEVKKEYRRFMDATGNVAPWHVLDAGSAGELRHEAFHIIRETVDAALAAGKYCGDPVKERFEMSDPIPRLSDADLTASLTDEEYEKQLKELQEKIHNLHNVIYRKRIPMIVCYEGWDAAGKGGNIRRLAYPLDPRGFDVHPIASPEPHELARHYLWRFWKRLPRSGHVAIFDRTWYGRVMVERIEGFCSQKDWQRAYNEMNEFEQELTDWGAIVLKFWIQIDSETQLARFTDRQNTPEKQWKITDEDWRNRDKWPQYEQAVSEMLAKTSTKAAPWHIIESVDKKYARIKTLRIVANAMEAAIEAKSK